MRSETQSMSVMGEPYGVSQFILSHEPYYQRNPITVDDTDTFIHNDISKGGHK